MLSKVSNFDPFSGISELVKNAESILSEQIELLRKFSQPQYYDLLELDIFSPIFSEGAKAIRNHFKLPPDGNNVIYVFYYSNQFHSASELENVVEGLKSVKHEGAKEGFTQVTTLKKVETALENININSVIMYVGTSQSMAKRLQEHVGHGSKGTATILLRKWPAHLPPNNYKISLKIADFGPEKISDSVKLIEYLLSNKQKPLIGHNRRA